MKPATVLGLGLWTPGFPDVASYLTGSADVTAREPVCAEVGSRLKRGTSVLTRAAVEVCGQALDDAGLDAAAVATVFGSAHGEMQIALDQMDMMREGDEVVSPFRFKNSVHNTAGGLFSIAADNRGFTTAIAGGAETLPMALLEALAWLEDGDVPVVVVVADESLPPPLDAVVPFDTLAVAFALGKGEGGRGRLAHLRRDPQVAAAPVPARFAKNPAAAALALLDALTQKRSGAVRLTATPGAEPWCVDVTA